MNFTTIALTGILTTALAAAAHAAWKAWHKAGDDDLMLLAAATRERHPVTEAELAEMEACWNAEFGGKR